MFSAAKMEPRFELKAYYSVATKSITGIDAVEGSNITVRENKHSMFNPPSICMHSAG